jgi:selenium-binding protein 1
MSVTSGGTALNGFRIGGSWDSSAGSAGIEITFLAAHSLPPILKPFKAVPPLVTDIGLSLDDRWLYVSCWGTGELKRFNVSDPFNPLETGSVRIGGIVRRQPVGGSEPLKGGPQMVELSRDGQRVYLSNGLYRSWEDQFYPDGLDGWLIKLDADASGGLTPDPTFLLHVEHRCHQVRLEGGDASSDSYCYP